MNELEDINTPSPPRSTSPVNKQSKVNPKQSSSGTANRKGGLLTLPMPPMVPGSEELSGDDDYISSPSSASHASTFKQNNTGFVIIYTHFIALLRYIKFVNSNLEANSLFVALIYRNSSGSNKKEVKRKRPTILHRRNSRSQAIKDWGERCVDVFEVIAQIGEGTYGQVILWQTMCDRVTMAA